MDEIVDKSGRPLATSAADLLVEHTGPSISGVRQIMPTHAASSITPEELAVALSEAESPGNGSIEHYLEIAERIEETYLHYGGVITTRKRAVSEIPIRVEPADDSPEAMADAEAAREIFKNKKVTRAMFDILDAIGKGFSATEIIWELSAKQWMPVELKWRLPQWFDFDRIDGETLLVRSADGWSPLPDYKMIIHKVASKSGITIRGGLARMAAWAWMYHSFDLKDWVRFLEAFGQPLRVGKYGPGASDADKRVLWRAVRDIAGDAAAIIPESMQLEFITDNSLSARGDLFGGLLQYLDNQISIRVLGQTLTTETGDSGSYALGQVHNLVRADVEDADAAALADTLTEQLVVPFITLNFGPRKEYPSVVIQRERSAELGVFSEALERMIKTGGMRVSAEEVRARFGLSAPADDEEILALPDAGMMAGMEPPMMARSRLRGQMARTTTGGDEDDLITAALDAITHSRWNELAAPLIEPVIKMAQARPEQLLENLADIYPAMDASGLEQHLAHVLFVVDMMARLPEQPPIAIKD